MKEGSEASEGSEGSLGEAGAVDEETLTAYGDDGDDVSAQDGDNETTETDAAGSDSDADVGRQTDDVSKWTAEDATSYLYGIKVRHGVSDNAFAEMWDGFRKVLPVLRKPSALPSAKTLKRTLLRDIPLMTVDVAYMDKRTREVQRLYGLDKVPRKRFGDRTCYEPLHEIWRTQLADAVMFHHSMHSNEEREVILNIDGVPIGRTGRSQTIVSVKFPSCRNVYQLTNAVQFAKGKNLSVSILMGHVLSSLKELHLDLLYISADAPMRSFIRNQKGHTSKLGCDYCMGKAAHKGRPVWGLDTLNCADRTLEGLKEDYERVARKEKTYADFGYRGRSEVLHFLPQFDIIEKVPVDPMHLLYLGVSRALFELLFAVGDNRPTNLTMPPLNPKALDDVLAQIKVPSEFPRRPRPMDFKNWKGSEWRSLVLIFFPIVAQVLRPGLTREIWLEFCYLCRAYSLDDAYFNNMDEDELQSLARNWYRKYYTAFADLNMRYNVHLMSHLARIRTIGPFPEISAFPFEGSFSAAARGQKVGTSSIGLQSMRYSYLRPIKGHTCKRSLKFSTKTTSSRQDNLLYTERSCFRLVADPGNDTFLQVRKLNCTTYFARAGSKLDYTAVGVFEFVSESPKVEYLRRDLVLGKLVAVPLADADVLVSVSKAQLREAE